MELRPTPAIEPRTSNRSIVLFDLDATLFDYTSLRMEATSAALDGIVADPNLISRELVGLLRPPLTDVLGYLAGLPDLRREWDSPEVLVLACLLNEPSGRQTWIDLAGAARKLAASEEDVSLRSRVKSYQYARKLREMPVGASFLKALSRIRDRRSQFFPEHCRLFREYIGAHASLAEGARDLISRLTDLGAEVHVVSEGDTAVQSFKFHSLGLKELAETCVVTDATCAVTPILGELFALYKDSPDTPQEVVPLYDQLAAYTVKSPAFFSKLLHALKDRGEGNVQERMQSARFCTGQEWQCSPEFSLVMIGDRYRKDLEPLLRICPSGAKAYRLLSGRYSREDPLDQLIAEHRPLPSSVFASLQELSSLTAAIAAPGDPVGRPAPVLPDPALVDRALTICGSGLSETSQTALNNLRSEALRHQNSDD